MTTINLIQRDGTKLTLDATDGQSLMETIRNAGVDELLALCGGCCSCATCHVHIDDASLAKLPAMTTDESDLLDSSDHRTASSRLSCQCIVTSDLAGMTVTIAKED